MRPIITKQIHDLRPADLEASPVWCFLPEDDPAAVDEWTLTPGEPGEAMHIVRATFRLADGRSFPGFVRPEKGLGASQPCMFVGDRSLTFWSGIDHPDPEYLAQAYRALGTGAECVFPIDWTTDVSGSATTAGRIEGFGFIRHGAEMSVR